MLNEMKYEPTLACDVDINNLDMLPYPLAALIKYDGVRVISKGGNYGRSLKLHKNPYLQSHLYRPEYEGFDSEGIVGDPEAPNCISVSSGGFSRQKDNKKDPSKVIAVDAKLYVFDDFSFPGTYEERHAAASKRVAELLAADPTHPLVMVPYVIINDAAELLAFEETIIGVHEGVILRTLNASYQMGRCSAKKPNYLRLKRFEEREAVITRVEEGQTNKNAAKQDALGHTERSTHQANMVPNGMIGCLYGNDTKTGVETKMAPGRMTNLEAKLWLEDQSLIVGQTVKYKIFPKGTGAFSKPRFPTFQCIRSPEDM